MYETHTTAEGHEILIAEMENDHLINTINLICRRLAQAIHVIKHGEDPTTDKVIEHLQPRYSAANLMEKARRELTVFDNMLAAYVTEAALRGLNVSQPLQKAYQRNSKIGQFFPGFNTDKLLEAEDEQH